MVRPNYFKMIASPMYTHVLCGWDGRSDHARGHMSRLQIPTYTHLFRHIFSKWRYIYYETVQSIHLVPPSYRLLRQSVPIRLPATQYKWVILWQWMCHSRAPHSPLLMNLHKNPVLKLNRLIDSSRDFSSIRIIRFTIRSYLVSLIFGWKLLQ